jgi:hypothetical protein
MATVPAVDHPAGKSRMVRRVEVQGKTTEVQRGAEWSGGRLPSGRAIQGRAGDMTCIQDNLRKNRGWFGLQP